MKLTFEMKHRNIVELILNNPNLPWLLVLSIPLVGLALGYRGFETAFLRSGAVMVMLAITSVYLNHFVIKADTFLNAIQTKIKNPNDDRIIKKAYLGDKKIDFNSAEDKAILDSLKSLSKEDIKKLETIQKKITYIEFLSGITGTFIWGFGDLLFSVKG